MRAMKECAPWLASLLVPLLAGCASTHYVEVYVIESGESCECTADMGQDKVDNVFAYPGDVIVWVNTTGGDLTLKPTLTGLFEAPEYVVPSRGRAMTPVVADAAGNFPIQLTCHTGGVAGPTIVVGDPP